MNLNPHYLILILLSTALSCNPDPTGPEMDCHLDDLYIQDFHLIKASKVFDVRTDPPKEIKNGSMEYKLSGQAIYNFDKDPVPYPYSEYFIDSIDFLSPATVEIHIFESEASKIYSFTRDDCSLELTAQDHQLQLELTNGGDEITEQRFAIYDHSSKWVTIDSHSFISDTFAFIEFRLGPFASYDEIINQFAKDHPGVYDTIAVELVQNKTRE